MSETKDYIDLNKRSFKDKLRAKLVEEDQKATKEMYPFCFRCAKLDMEDKLKKTFEEAERTGNVDKEIFDLTKLDLTKYKSKDRFRKVATKEAIDPVRVGLGVKHILIGHHESYVCKERGCGRDVFVPLKDKVEDKK